MNYADRIQFLRKKSKLTQEELANLIGIKRHTIGDWETNRTEPNINNLKLLAEFFNVSIDYILGNEEINYNNSIDFEIQKNHLVFIAENELTNELYKEIKECNTEQQQIISYIIKNTNSF